MSESPNSFGPARMAAHILIDLSLRTDDERSSQAKASKPKADVTIAMATKEFSILSDGFDATDSDGSQKENPVKKRKLDNPTVHGPQLASSTAHVGCPRPVLSKRTPLTSRISAGHDRKTHSDEIVFTSSADINYTISRPLTASRTKGHGEDSDGSLPEDAFSAAPSSVAACLTGRTAALVAKLKDPVLCKVSSGSRASPAALASMNRRTGSPTTQRVEAGNVTSSEEEGKSRPKVAKRSKPTEGEKSVRLREREGARLERNILKAKDKDEEKERRRLQREEKAREKQRAADLSEVNKTKKDKKKTAKEMIVDLPLSIGGQRVDDQIREFLRNLEIETNTYQSPISNVIRWRRKVESCFDEGKGYRVAIPKEIRGDKHALCLMQAKDFIELVIADPASETLAEHIHSFTTKFDGYTLIYLIEGFNAWMRKNKNLREESFELQSWTKLDWIRRTQL